MSLAFTDRMITGDRVNLLLEALRCWREEGLIDVTTHQRLMERCQRPEKGAATLDQELEERAEALVRADEPAGPDMDQQLEAEAAFHLEFEHEVQCQEQARGEALAAAGAVSVHAREARLARAGARAAGDVLGLPPGVEDVEATPAERVLERDSIWAARVRPFLHANALWLAGGMLVLFGSIYFLRLAWEALSSLLLHGAIAGALLGYGAAFFVVGYMLCRRQGQAVGQILFCFAAALFPIASLAVGELAALLVRELALPGLLLAGGAVCLSTAAQGFMLAVMGGLYERAAAKPLVVAGTGLALLCAAVSPAASLLAGPPAEIVATTARSGAGYLALCGAGFITLWAGLRSLTTCGANLRTSLLFVCGALSWSFVVLVGRLHAAAPVAPTHYAGLVAALAGVFIIVDHRLRQGHGGAPRLTAIGLGLHAAILASLALSIAGLVRIGYFDLGARLTVLLTSSVAVFFFARGAVRHGRSALTHLAAVAGLLTYFFLPAPFAGLILLAKKWFSAALGYANSPLPVAFYGLTFIPYVLGLTLLALYLRRRRPDLVRDLLRFLTALSSMLVVLALGGGSNPSADLRPVLWTWPLYAAAAFFWGLVFRRRHLVRAGHVLAGATLWALGVWIDGRTGRQGFVPLLLAVHGLALAGAALRWPAVTDLGRAALLAVGGALLALFIHPAGAGGTCGCLVLVAAALALVAAARSAASAPDAAGRAAAHIAGLLLFGSTLAGCVAWAPSDAAATLAVLAHAAAASTVVHLSRRRRKSDPQAWLRIEFLIGGPGVVTSLLALTLALAYSQVVAGLHWVPALTALMFCHLIFVSRAWPATAIAAGGLALAAAAVSGQLLDQAWPLALCPLAVLYLVGAARGVTPRGRHGSAAPRRALAAVAFLVEAVSLSASVAVASSATSPLVLAAAGFGGAAIFSAVAALLHRRRPVAAALSIGGVAAATLVTAALLIIHADPAAPTLGWRLGALCAAASLVWSQLASRLPRAHLRATSRWIAAALPVLPVLMMAGFTLLAGAACGRVGGWLAGLVQLEVGADALICAACCLLAATWARRTRPGALTHQLWSAAVAGTCLVAFATLAPGVHLTTPLCLAALLLAWLHQRPLGGSAAPRFAWPLALCGLAVLCSHLHLDRPHLLLGLAGLTFVTHLKWRGDTSRRRGLLEAGWATGVVFVLQAAAIWGAALLSTGRHPTAAVLALMAPAALLSALALERYRRWWFARETTAEGAAIDPLRGVALVATLSLMASGALGLLSIAGCQPVPPDFVIALAAATLAAAGALMVRAGHHDNREWLVAAGGLALTALYGVLRTQTALAAAGPSLDVAAVLITPQVAFWLAAGRGEGALRRPLLAAAALWPLGTLLVAPQLSPWGASLLFLLTAIHYATMARVLKIRHLTAPALAAGNAALFVAFGGLAWTDLLLHALPVSVAALTLVHVYRADIGARGTRALRTLILLALYTLATSRAALALSPLEALVVVPALCVGGIIAGTVMRVRSHVLLGSSFLALDLMLNMIRYGLARPHLGAAFLTLLGLILVAGMVVFSLERERILRRYSVIIGELRTWE